MVYCDFRVQYQTLTIQRMILECAVLQESHDDYYTVVPLNTVFETIPEIFLVEFIWTPSASKSSIKYQNLGQGPGSIPGGASAPCALEQGASRGIVPLDRAANGYFQGQICKPWYHVACERLHTPPRFEAVQIDVWILKAQWPGKAHVKSWCVKLGCGLKTKTKFLSFTNKHWLLRAQYLFLYL